MDILQSIGLPIDNNPIPSNEIEIYGNDYSKINIFYYTNENQEKYFLVEIKNEKLLQKNILKNLLDIINNPNQGILTPIKIFLKNDFSFFIQFEYSEITLSNFIKNSEPSLETRLNLLKQFIIILIHFHNNNIELDCFDINYIFIKNLGNPILQIFYNGNFIYNS